MGGAIFVGLGVVVIIVVVIARNFHTKVRWSLLHLLW